VGARATNLSERRALRHGFRHADGRWIADIPELPGVTVYGASMEEARIKAAALALRVIAEEIEHGELEPEALQ
jgi:predicted RNase H-like HicB family nuclease